MKAGTSQRRPGLHVDSPGRVKFKHDSTCQSDHALKGAGASDNFDGGSILDLCRVNFSVWQANQSQGLCVSSIDSVSSHTNNRVIW